MTDLGKTKKLCPNGHLMDPAWDVCPYCPGDRRADGDLAKTIIADPNQEETAMTQNNASPDLAKTIKITEETVAASASASSAARKTQVMNVPSQIEGIAWLVGVKGGEKGQTHKIAGERTTVGAEIGCEVKLSDDRVSDRHASIRFSDQTFVLTDLDSTNGTYVNDNNVQRETLNDGDRVRFGASEWVFKCVVFEED